jgi:hypothetical protein
VTRLPITPSPGASVDARAAITRTVVQAADEGGAEAGPATATAAATPADD